MDIAGFDNVIEKLKHYKNCFWGSVNKVQSLYCHWPLAGEMMGYMGLHETSSWGSKVMQYKQSKLKTP